MILKRRNKIIYVKFTLVTNLMPCKIIEKSNQILRQNLKITDTFQLLLWPMQKDKDELYLQK